jgi:hypothetical protein
LTAQPSHERLPNTPINSFKFNSSSASFAKAEVELQIEALETRIDNIVKKFTVEGNPVLGLILQLTHNKEELAGLSKGLGRLADIIGPYDELQQRKQLLEIAEKDPNWLAWAFGDFDQEIDEAIVKLFSTEES